MEFKQIQDLVKLINKTDLTEVQVEEENFKITIKKEKETTVQNVTLAAPQGAGQPLQPTQPIAPAQEAAAPAGASQTPAPPAASNEADSNLITIKSPMIGTFYRSSGPDKPAFANVGDAIAPGKVVCIIEAMKLFNEVESEVSGKIVKILVDDATPVEYDQPLFLVEP